MARVEVRHPLRLVAVLVGVVLVILVVVFADTFSAPERRTLPPPDPTATTRPDEPTTTIDHSRIVLQPVAGQTTTSLAETGSAVLRGVVTGPSGGVGGAVVRVERLVGDAVQVHEARTGGDGAWVLDGLPGGRMRVRAFAPPSLTMLEPEIFFLADAEQRELRLVLREHAGLLVLADVTPQAPTVDSAVSVAVRVLARVVDDSGVARTRPVPSRPVEVRSSGWELLDAPAATDGEGVAVFTFRCDRVGTVTASALVTDGAEERIFSLDVPSCAPRPTTTTSTTSTSVPGGATTTAPPTSTEGD